jgi:acetate kinase
MAEVWVGIHIAARSIYNEVFYGTQYHTVPPVENDSYVIEKDIYVRIRRYGWY